jgi:pimeloyl-ACP methyl ester carboxylesterase
VLGVERAGLLGHDWGAWTCWLVTLRAPARVERMLALNMIHPWGPRGAAAANGWRLLYQPALAVPYAGPVLARRFARLALGRSMDAATAAVYADVLDEPARAEASSRVYRDFLLRDLPALARGQGIPAGTDVPVLVLAGRQDPAIHPSQLGGLRAHAPAGDLELVDGGHFLVDERPELVADRARAWFA